MSLTAYRNRQLDLWRKDDSRSSEGVHRDGLEAADANPDAVVQSAPRRGSLRLGVTLLFKQIDRDWKPAPFFEGDLQLTLPG